MRAFLAAVLTCIVTVTLAERSFRIENDRFIKDGSPIQIFSGSIHYQRIHPAYWRDRLLRVKALGLNAIQFYVVWNLHEPKPGEYNWEGFADVERFLDTANELDLMVFLRPGPYACGEWEFGGFPAWLGSKYVDGGGTMTLRVSDEQYLQHVDRWWSVALPRFTKHLYKNGGPIVLSQIENEYGFCWRGPDPDYLQFLVEKTRQYLDKDVIIYTTDPPYVIKNGTIAGDEVYSVVDFGPGTDVEYAFTEQAKLNPKGGSPPLNSEFYTGWITTWSEKMANTSSEAILKTLDDIIQYGNQTGSVNLYMAHGGTNFGYWAGANIQSADPTPPDLIGKEQRGSSHPGAQQQGPATSNVDIYKPTMTSYDYDCPISESGRTGQPGIGGPNKFELLRDAFNKASGRAEIKFPEPLPLEDYGEVKLYEAVTLLNALKDLRPEGGIPSHSPERMENYNQSSGFTIYRTQLHGALFANGAAVLDIGGPVHDFAQILLDGEVVGFLERNVPKNVTLRPPVGIAGRAQIQLDIVLHAMGRVNFGCIWDLKGLVHGDVRLNGEALHDWMVFPLDLTNIEDVRYQSASEVMSSQNPRQLIFQRDSHQMIQMSADRQGPIIYRGFLNIDENTAKGPTGHLPDSYISVRQWHKGLAFINGFNLGWYWPRVGPQGAQYVPGPLLRPGKNEIVLLEVEGPPFVAADRTIPSVHLTKHADFAGANSIWSSA